MQLGVGNPNRNPNASEGPREPTRREREAMEKAKQAALMEASGRTCCCFFATLIVTSPPLPVSLWVSQPLCAAFAKRQKGSHRRSSQRAAAEGTVRGVLLGVETETAS